MAHRAIFVLAIASTAVWVSGLALPGVLSAQSVWSGFDVSFSKSNFAEPALPESQDRINDDVWLTRGNSQGLFNIRSETGYSSASPASTQWATGFMPSNGGKTIAAANWQELDFTTWTTAYGSGGSLAFNITAFDAVVRLVGDEMTTDDDIYLDLRFTNWTSSGAGGGFSYMRAQAPAPPMTTGDYNGNGLVDAADYVLWRATLDQPVATLGDGADGNANGTIDAGDYDFWRARFGSTVPGFATVGGTRAVPEPAAIFLALLAAGGLAARRR